MMQYTEAHTYIKMFVQTAKGNYKNVTMIFSLSPKERKTRGKTMNKSVFGLFMSLLAAFVLCLTVAAQGYSWYFKPANDGKRPMLCPEADFVKNYDAVTVGNEGEKKIYLTFDAGYENGNVEKILDILKANEVKGTFFILPRLAEHNTDLCKRMKEEGHIVGNHSVHHRNMGMYGDIESFRKVVEPLDAFFEEKTGYKMDKFFRPPEGAFSENTLKFAERLGYTTVFWSLAYADWDNNKQMNPDKALQLLLSRTHDGCVLLLHPTSETNTKILDRYIKTMKERGYEFGLVNELKKSTDG